MSAPQPYDDRADESLRRAQRAHEPSMEEILASIRAIIADDKANVAAKTAAARVAPAASSQVIYSNFGQRAAEAAAQQAQAPTPTVVWSRPDETEEPQAAEPAPAQVAAPAPTAEVVAPAPAPIEEAYESAEEQTDEPLLSEEADLQITTSFQALAASLAVPDPQRVEEIARDLLRPMMKVWLDENLPSLVERLVRAEIQRLARGGR